ncbi:MAG: hypothetical protein ACRCYU_07875 [Nocardioides sp.]
MVLLWSVFGGPDPGQASGESENVRYADLCKVCEYYLGLGAARMRCSRCRGPGDPRVNIQNAKGKAKPYQVRQVLAALEEVRGDNNDGT